MLVVIGDTRYVYTNRHALNALGRIILSHVKLPPVDFVSLYSPRPSILFICIQKWLMIVCPCHTSNFISYLFMSVKSSEGTEY